MGGPGAGGLTPATLVLLLALALVLFAHSPVLGAGLLAWDSAALFGPGASPVAAAWCRASLAAWGAPTPGSEALPWRLEQLACLLGIALALRAFLVRLLAPWLDPRAARPAALAAALLVLVHPLAPVVIARIDSRAELAGLLLGLGAGASFLKGRQEERDGPTAASLALIVAAGFSSPVAVPLAGLIAASEFLCARRHRARSRRLRTTATTAALFMAGASLPRLLVGAGAQVAGLPDPSIAEELHTRALAAGEALVRVVLPARSGAGFLLAAALCLVALQPAVRAAQHAPRLWGGILCAWGVLLAVAIARSGPSGRGRELLGLVAWSAGLGLAVTAGGPRRGVRPAVVVLGLAVLAHAGARPWLAGSRAQERLRGELLALAGGHESRVLVVDPPEVDGLEDLWLDVGWLLHPGDRRLSPGSFDPARVRSLSGAAFLALAGTDALAELRAEKALVLAPERALGGSGVALRAVQLAAPRPSAPLRPWRRLTYVPEQPLDPLDWEYARLVADLATAPRDLEELEWHARSGETGSELGLVSERGGRRVAEFDLSRSLAWRLAGAVRSLVVKRGKREPLERGELLERLPHLPGVGSPVSEGRDWLFATPRLEASIEPGARYVLTLLALSDLELRELPLEPDPSGRLRARGAQRFAASRAGREGVAWSLDCRVGPQALFRARGRVP